jgi:hypothetical protein
MTEKQKSVPYAAHKHSPSKREDYRKIIREAEADITTNDAIVKAMRLAFSTLNKDVQMELSWSRHKFVRLQLLMNFNIHTSVVKSIKHRPEYAANAQVSMLVARTEQMCDYRQKRLLEMKRGEVGKPAEDFADLHLEHHKPTRAIVLETPRADLQIAPLEVVIAASKQERESARPIALRTEA